MSFTTDTVKKQDHLKIVSATYTSLLLAERIDTVLSADERERITDGEAVKAMILYGLGLANDAIRLTPQFFEDKPLEDLIKKNIVPRDLNRFKLGRTLDKIAQYGPSKLFAILASHICAQEKIFASKNATDHSENKFSPAKKTVLDFMAEQKSGLDFMAETWKESPITSIELEKRTFKLIEKYKTTGETPYFILDSKLYTYEHLKNIHFIPFITKVSSALKERLNVIVKAQSEDKWEQIPHTTNKFQEFPFTHAGTTHRWFVLYSQVAQHTAAKKIDKQTKLEEEAAHKALFHLKAQRFTSEDAAHKALEEIAKQYTYTYFTDPKLQSFVRYKQKGRPKDQSTSFNEYQITAQACLDQESIACDKKNGSYFVLATNITNLPAEAILNHYRLKEYALESPTFIEDKSFLSSAVFLKNESRVQALSMIMVLTTLICSIAQRRLQKTTKGKNT